MPTDFKVRLLTEEDMDAVVELSLLAWQPVFASFRHIMGAAIFTHLYPDWRSLQADVVKTYCQAQENRTVWVAEVDHAVAGFIVCDLNHETKQGDVQLLAVHPGYQKRGIAAALNEVALQKMKESGMKLAYVGTGGDPGHAPARRSYEKAGYTGVPAVHYFQHLES
jgi:GNAT superfamily N-acetyltransferase